MPRIVTTYREEAKKKVLAAALEVFKEKGYFRSTMDDIAKKLGISKSAIYQYFESKDQLLAALYTSGPENLRSQFSGASKRGLVATTKDVFGRMGTKENADLFADFLAEASRNEDLQKVLRDNIERFTGVVEDLLKDANPKMKPEETEQAHQVSVMMGLIFNGLASWLAVGVPESEVKEIWGRSVDMLLGPYERNPPTPRD
ncbi:MAG: TetR/AcrR family transcriptional regulator [Nitrososphaerales archaeon]